MSASFQVQQTGRMRSNAAFTLIELMIVIAIFLILIAIAVPAFASMLYSSEQSLAENSLRSALSSAREAAVRSPEGQDAVAVFTYDPVKHRTQAITCVAAGTLRNPPGGVTPPVLSQYEVFAAAPGTQAVQFPRGWSVRGYAPADSIDDVWYEKTYPAGAARDRGNWVFPESGFYNEDMSQTGDDRQTFAVRFEGGTGTVKSADQMPIVVLLPSPTVVFRNMSPWSKYRADTAADPVRFVKQVLTSPVTGAGSISPSDRQKLLGFLNPTSVPSPGLATDCILAKPVGQLAVCNEKRLAQAIGVQLDRDTESLYQNPSAAGYQPKWVNTRSGAWSDSTDTVRLNAWIEGHLQDPNNAGQTIDSDCRIFVVQRYLGSLQEVTGTIGGQGVGQ